MEQVETILSPKQAAERLGITTAHLQRLRSEGGGPKFCLLGKRRLAYRAADLNAWLASRVAVSTSDARDRGRAA
ncbi:MAG: helix-turn-helix domain-containing protein [Hyphomicrobium sp.]